MKLLPSRVGVTLRRLKDYDAMSRAAADFVYKEVSRNPGLLFCASAGGTPTGLYREMEKDFKKPTRHFSKLRVLQIDEWGGLPTGHPASCRTDLETKLLGPLKISPSRFEGFCSQKNGEQEARRIKDWLAKNGPIDICVLGLGLNGHIAMNEPATEFISDPHVAKLAKTSLNHGMLKDLVRKPRYGLTLGMGDILRSKKILLVVSGESKREIMGRLLKSDVTSQLPASFLWLHSDVTALCDMAALP